MAHWLGERGQEDGAGAISLAEFDASVQSWITHVHYAATWGLRQHVLDTPLQGHNNRTIRGFDEASRSHS